MVSHPHDERTAVFVETILPPRLCFMRKLGIRSYVPPDWHENQR